jgi:hypothetical protein
MFKETGLPLVLVSLELDACIRSVGEPASTDTTGFIGDEIGLVGAIVFNISVWVAMLIGKWAIVIISRIYRYDIYCRKLAPMVSPLYLLNNITTLLTLHLLQQQLYRRIMLLAVS